MIDKKIKYGIRKTLVGACSLMLGFMVVGNYMPNTVLKATEEYEHVGIGEWREENTIPRGEIDFGDYVVRFGFGTTSELQRGTLASNKVQLSKPNVYIVDKGRVVDHIWANGNHTSSGNFNFAFPIDNDTTGSRYEVFESQGLGGRIFTQRDAQGNIVRIKGVVEKDTTKYGRIEITTVMTKRIDKAVDIDVSVKNLSENSYKIAYVKKVDTELAGNDGIPVYMLGQNEGLYMDAGNYRVNYVVNVPNGPNNFMNHYYGGYRHLTGDRFGDTRLPFNPVNNLNGTGVETRNIPEDTSVGGTGDTGIFMKWNVRDLGSNETADYSYRIGLVSRFDSKLGVANNTSNEDDAIKNEDNYVKDTLKVKTDLKILKNFKSRVERGVVTSVLNLKDMQNQPLGTKVVVKSIKVVNEVGDTIREIPVDAFNYDTQTVNMEFTNSDVIDGKVHLVYELDANVDKDSVNNVDAMLNISNRSTVTFNDKVNISSVDKVDVNIKKIYGVNYSFMTESNLQMPDDILNATPQDVELVRPTTVVNADRTFETRYVDQTNDGVWNFRGYDKDSVTITNKNETFTGTWDFVPNKYEVTHEFRNGYDNTQLPQEIASRLPENQTNKVNGERVNGTVGFETRYVDVDKDGTWSFDGWGEEKVVNKGNVNFVGTWNFIPNRHNVTYSFEKNTNVLEKYQIPIDVMNRLPLPQNDLIKGQAIEEKNITENTYVDMEQDGTWTFETWDKNPTTMNKENIEIVGTWNFVPNKYKVKHTFQSSSDKQLHNTIVVPEDIENKVTGDEVTPTETFEKNVVDEENDGTWVFATWDSNTKTINKGDAIFVGTWNFVPNKHMVTHTFESTNNAYALPQEILNRLPSNQENKVKGDKVTPDENFDKEFEYRDETNDGIWNFSNWDKERAFVDKGNVNFIGLWDFTPNTYTVTYEYVTDSGKEIPTEIIKPNNINGLINNDMVNPMTLTETVYDDVENDGAWNFVGWDKENITINKANDKFVGKWNFTPKRYDVNYEFNQGLPNEIMNLLPNNELGTKVNKEEVTAPTLTQTRYEDTTRDGVWTFKGWDMASKVINKGDVAFKGTWEFVANEHDITYKFEDNDKYPQELKDLLPTPTKAVQGTKVTPTLTRTVVEDSVNDGTWVFKGWNKSSFVVGKEAVEVVGSWIFSPNKYKVDFEFIGDLSKEVLDMLPQPQENVVKGQAITFKEMFDTVTTEEGIYEFVSWDKENELKVEGNTKVVGTWKLNSYYTELLDEDGKVISKEKGKKAPNDLEGYIFQETKVEGLITRHYYKKKVVENKVEENPIKKIENKVDTKETPKEVIKKEDNKKKAVDTSDLGMYHIFAMGISSLGLLFRKRKSKKKD